MKSRQPFLTIALTLMTMGISVLTGCRTAAPATPVAAVRVVFVCEHGNVKSLIAASLFERVAQQRGLPFQGVARGMNPEAGVPAKIAAALAGEGVDVSRFVSQSLTSVDLGGAVRVVAIGVDVSSAVTVEEGRLAVWNDVPPASVDYAAARAALQRHIDELLADLQSREP